MNTIIACLLLAGGLILLWKAADVLVSGAVGLASRLGISSLVVGLTVVAMGTSAPEVAASIAAALRGSGDIALGNVYGSNIANLALVGGVSCLIMPLTVRAKTLKREIPVMLLVALLLWPILFNLSLTRIEGVILLVIFTGLMIAAVISAKREVENSTISVTKSLGISIFFIIIGLIGLAIGAELTLRGAIFIGEKVGLSKAVIGLTIIAIGTSLPELATCVVAAVKGHEDISIGNLVGSNIFNALLVTGTAGVVKPFTIQSRLAGTDYWIMVAVSAIFILMVWVGKKISRIDGFILLVIYTTFMVYLLAFSR